MMELHPPAPTAWHDVARLGAIVRIATARLFDQNWQVHHISKLWEHGGFEQHLAEYWEKWTQAEKEEVIRRWTMYKLES